MPESISGLLALLVGLVVMCLLWRSLSRGEHLGWGRGREPRHEDPVKAFRVNRPRTGPFGHP
jgi:hypothetical protein